jgi:hypothetical protein
VQCADKTEARRQFVGSCILQIVGAKLNAKKVTIVSCYEHPEACGTIEHADDFVVVLPVCAEDGWTAGLLVVLDSTAIGSSWLVSVPSYEIVGNKVFEDCSSELYRQANRGRCEGHEQLDTTINGYQERTLLSQALRNGHELVVELLLEKGVKLDLGQIDDRRMLSYGASNRHEAVVRLRLDTDQVDVDSKDSKWGQTPLLWATKNRHEAIVKLLCEHFS